MQIRELNIPDSYEITPTQHGDSRGVFFEWYRFDRLEETLGHSLKLRQANGSVSAKGVVRGIHFADIPIGQAKYVTCPFGAVIDFVIDIRVGSPTFGQWDSVLLDGVDRKAIYVAEGLGHAFVSLTDGAVVNYLVSDIYRAEKEHGINPLDPDVALDFPLSAEELVLSPKDTSAPGLHEAEQSGLLPTYASAQQLYQSLKAES